MARASQTRSTTALSRRRRLKFTRDGRYFVALTLGVGFAAINTGNNLLYLVLGMMLSLIVGSGVLSEIALRGLIVARDIAPRIYAGQPVLIGVGLSNTKRRLPSLSIEIEDVGRGVQPGKRCFFLKVPAGRTQRTSYRDTYARRGVHQLEGFRVHTKFPFGLFAKSRWISAPQEVIVYPTLHPVFPPPIRSVGHGGLRLSRPGRRGEFHALREFREGDDRRDIYWRKSAQLGRALVRQNDDPSGLLVSIYLDNGQAQPLLSPADIDRREAAVSEAASLAACYIEQGHSVALVTRTTTVRSGDGAAQLDRLLRALAVIDFVDPQRPFAPAAGGGHRLFVRPASAATTASLDPPRAA